MIEHVPDRASLTWVLLETKPDEVFGIRADRVTVWHAKEIVHTCCLDALQYLRKVLAGERHLAGQHYEDHNRGRPHIDLVGIRLVAEDLRCHVKARADHALNTLAWLQLMAETEVSQPDLHPIDMRDLIDENVLKLYVAMDYLHPM